MPVRLTDTVDRKRLMYRGRRGFIYGWTLHPACIPEEMDGEWLLDRLPLVIYVRYPEATWQIGKLPTGVYPMTAKSRTWKVNKYTGIEARRTGYSLLPDFASTAHMIQGATLDAVFSDAQEAGGNVSMAAQIAAYVGFTRIKELCKICVLQPFSPWLFARGPPSGPERLIRKLSGKISSDEALEEWVQDTQPGNEEAAAGNGNPITNIAARVATCEALKSIRTQCRSLVCSLEMTCTRSTFHKGFGRDAWNAKSL
jgi:hypothetical protein